MSGCAPSLAEHGFVVIEQLETLEKMTVEVVFLNTLEEKLDLESSKFCFVLTCSHCFSGGNGGVGGLRHVLEFKFGRMTKLFTILNCGQKENKTGTRIRKTVTTIRQM